VQQTATDKKNLIKHQQQQHKTNQPTTHLSRFLCNQISKKETAN